jgi:uncharacterized membrane protein HdeD (DUF308 family)
MAQTDLQHPASPMPAVVWALAIRGIVAVLFGLVALVWPGITLSALVLLFGAYAFVDGIFAIVAAFRQEDRGVRWLVLLEGVLGVLLGVLTFLWPGTVALALLYVIAAWAIITGILEIAAAVGLRRVIRGEWALIVGGLASVIFGVLLAVWPREGLLAFVWIFGIYALVFGVMQLVHVYRVRRRHNA